MNWNAKIVMAGMLVSFSVVAQQDVKVDKIRVFNELRQGVDSVVYRHPLGANRQIVDYAPQGELEPNDLACRRGEHFSAEKGDQVQIGYAYLYTEKSSCSSEIEITLIAPGVPAKLAEYASLAEMRGDYSTAAALYIEAHNRIDFGEMSTQKVEWAQKGYQAFEMAVDQNDIFSVTEQGWPVLTSDGSEAILQLQARAGVTLTGQLDSSALTAIDAAGLGSYIARAYRDIDQVQQQ